MNWKASPTQFNDMGARLQESYADLENKVEQRTAELSESLQQQTATSNVLKVISRSAFDLDSVMNTLGEVGARTLRIGYLHAVSSRGRYADVPWRGGGARRAHRVHEKTIPFPINYDSHMGRSVLSGTVANVGDFESNPHTKLRKFQQAMGFKAFLAGPLDAGGARSWRVHTGPQSSRRLYCRARPNWCKALPTRQ